MILDFTKLAEYLTRSTCGTSTAQGGKKSNLVPPASRVNGVGPKEGEKILLLLVE